ncbi:tissue factor pathway inhibitor 2 [Paramuricea clavata]|uniref:Tissue factor pathway inhibitor 2 n=1 Tax=Paramuricea clavata TaxID=317549 RepID=A0A7D9HUQ8_PARCT|nr:tissue factor pathway inhibitor 2 [Paramuricea clavata]
MGSQCGGAVCSLPKVVGPCKARFVRYYFNTITQKCEVFYYGGCRSNGNNFRTKKLCEGTCKSDQDVCSLPAVQGPCEAHIGRYFYNVTSSKCERFYYGGCQGNKNNFKTIKDCEKNCKRSGNPCDLVFCGVNGRCKVMNGKAICTLSVLANPCIATSCLVGTRCVVVNGKGRCIPVKPVPTVHPSCAAVSCLQGTTCVVRNGRPLCATTCSASRGCKQQGSFCNLASGICQCSRFCLAVHLPVCGSDGKRYGNKCHLDAAACRAKKTITTVPCYENSNNTATQQPAY